MTIIQHHLFWMYVLAIFPGRLSWSIKDTQYCSCISLGMLDKSCFEKNQLNCTSATTCTAGKLTLWRRNTQCLRGMLKAINGSVFYAKQRQLTTYINLTNMSLLRLFAISKTFPAHHRIYYKNLLKWIKRLPYKEQHWNISRLGIKRLNSTSFSAEQKEFYATTELFIDTKILDFILALTGPFRFHLSVKMAHYPNVQWNHCSNYDGYEDLFANLFLRFRITYVGHNKFYLHLRSGFVANSKKIENSILFLRPPRYIGEKSGYVLSIVHLDAALKNIGFELYCCQLLLKPYKRYSYLVKLRWPLFPSFLKSTTDRPSAPNQLTLGAVRTFYNSSIEFELEWDCDMSWSGPPKSYEILCKFYNANDSRHYSEACVKCVHHSLFCQQCWTETVADLFAFGPYLFAETSWKQHKHSFLIQTNMSGVTMQKISRNQHRMMDYLFIFRSDIYKFLRRYDADPRHVAIIKNFLRRSIVFPGRYSYPKQLNGGDVKNVFALCAVRGRKASGLAGKWSRSVKVRFANYTKAANFLFGRQLLSISNPGLQLAGKHNDGSFRRTGEVQYQVGIPIDGGLFSYGQNGVMYIWGDNMKMTYGIRLVGCYHWILNVWYAFVWDRKTKKYVLSMYFGGTSDLEFDWIAWIKILEINGIPVSAKCPPLHSFFIWTEETGSKIKVFKANINPRSGHVILPPYEVDQAQLCKCANLSTVSSGVIELFHKDVVLVSLPLLLTVCNKTLCTTELKTDGMLKAIETVNLPPDLQNITSIAADSDGIFVAHKTNCKKYQFGRCRESYAPLYMYDRNNTVWVERQTYVAKYKVTYRQHFYPGFKPFLSHDTTNLELGKPNRYPVNSQLTAANLPVPSANCMFPEVADVGMQMLSGSSCEFKVQYKWKEYDECKGLAKPSVVLQVKYFLIASDSEPKALNTSISQLKCGSYFVRTCLVSQQKASRNETPKLVLGSLLNHRYYYLEIGVLPNLTAAVQKRWYSGQPYHFVKRRYRTSYEPNKDMTSLITTIAGSAGGAVVAIILLLLTIIVWMYKRTWYMYRTLQRLSASDIIKREKLGQGHFGEVWKANVRGKTAVVKTLKESASHLEEKEFREEALILSTLKCENIVKPLGICLQTRPVMLALEYVNGGSVESYLKTDSVRRCINGSDMFLIAQDALKGCLYLEAKGYVHRDLAARNCLVQTWSPTNVKPKQVKLSDFGLAKDVGSSVYKCRVLSENKVPVGWTAPEAFAGEFSAKSDIWSFGVLIWETFSWSSHPFGHCSINSASHQCPLEKYSNDQIEEMVTAESKTLADLPDPCISQYPEKLKGLMQWCWSQDPDERPSFTQLSKFLVKIREDVVAITCTGATENALISSHSNQQPSNVHSCQEAIGLIQSLRAAYSSSSHPSGSYPKNEIAHPEEVCTTRF